MCILKSLKSFLSYYTEIFTFSIYLPCIKHEEISNEDIFKIQFSPEIQEACDAKGNNCIFTSFINNEKSISKIELKDNLCFPKIWDCEVNYIEVHYLDNLLNFITITFINSLDFSSIACTIFKEILDEKITSEINTVPKSKQICWDTDKYEYILKDDGYGLFSFSSRLK